MPHVPVPEGMPGITGLLNGYPETGAPLRLLAQQLLRGPSPLSPAERETIAAYVSKGNDCTYCHGSHAAAARQLPGGAVVDEVCSDLTAAPLSPKMRALLRIAGKVREGGKHVAAEDVRAARQAGAGDRDIHDAVLVAAAFCMFNRYVDGLATVAPSDRAAYDAIGVRLATTGYNAPAQQHAAPR